MGTILKLTVAFGVGFAALASAQHLWVKAVTSQVRAEAARSGAMPPQAQIKPFPAINPNRLPIGPTVGKIDTRTGQRLAVENAARRVDIQIRNAQSAVPVPRRYPGMPRY